MPVTLRLYLNMLHIRKIGQLAVADSHIQLISPLSLVEGAFADGEPHGQTRGGAGGGERPGRGGQGVHEGHRRH